MTRSASDSLRGYSYQFHESIVRLLDTPNDEDVMVLEGVEDIDLENECVQVKYLSSKKLLPSSVQKPVSLMLEDYVCNHAQRQDTTYKIYAYFGDASGDGGFLDNDQFYNDCAETLIADKGKDISEISNEMLQEFRGKFILEVGNSFEDQVKSVKQKLSEVFGAPDKETDLYFYPNAMSLVLSLSIQSDETARAISKKDFLSSINQKKILFGIWQKLEKGKEAFLSDIKKALASGDFRSNKERLIFLDANYLGRDTTGYGGLQLILSLIDKHSLIGKNTTAKPLTVVVGASDDEIISLKSQLIDNGLEFNDGYEQISFSADAFNSPPVINTMGRIARKIGRTSYEIKLVGLSAYVDKLDSLNRPHTAIYFSENTPFDLEGVVQYHMPTIKNYREISEILN